MIHFHRKMMDALKYLFVFLPIWFTAIIISYYIFLRPKPILELSPGSYAIYSPDGESIVVTRGGVAGQETYPAAYILDASNGTRLAQLASSATTNEAAFSFDRQRLVTSGYYDRLFFWDTASWQQVMAVTTSGPVCDLDYDPERALLIVATCGPGGGHISILDANSGEELERLLSYPPGWVHIKYSPDGKYVAAATNLDSGEGTLYVWDAATYQEFRHFDQCKDVNGMAWSPNEPVIATVDENGWLRIRSLTTGKIVAEIKQSDSLRDVSYSPDGRFIAVGGQRPTTIWDTTSWGKVGFLGKGNVRSINYSPDGKFIVITREARYSWAVDVFKASDVVSRGGILGFLDKLFSDAGD